VVISRKLGIQYLWIDSLSIIQDSRTDWEKESAVMGDVYGRSYLTIAARGAANAEVGCFIPRKEEPPACCLEYKNGSTKGRMYVRDPAFQLERIDQSPLMEEAGSSKKESCHPGFYITDLSSCTGSALAQL
jgi:hypothetical protein